MIPTGFRYFKIDHDEPAGIHIYSIVLIPAITDPIRKGSAIILDTIQNEISIVPTPNNKTAFVIIERTIYCAILILRQLSI